MAEQVKLYDIRRRDYPNQRGDSFRSLQVFECWVCGSVTNRVVMGGYPGYGVRAICPNSAERWHHELDDKIELLGKSHPKSYKEELEKEIKALQKARAKDIKKDIKGHPDFNLKNAVSNVRSYKPGR